MVDFDVILGMDRLSFHHEIVNCHAKIINLATLRCPIVELRGSISQPHKCVISFLKTRQYAER